MSVYEDLETLYFKIKAKKELYAKEIAIDNAKIEVLDSTLTDIECILSENGKHIYEHFE